MPKFGEILFGKKDKTKQVKTLVPEQEELLTLIKQGLASGEGPLGELFGKFNEGQFNEGVTKPALKNFEENILPQISAKFSAGNAVQGSGFRRATLKAGTDLQSKLAELMYGAQQTQKQNQIQGLQTGLGTKAVENIYRPGGPGLLQGFATGAGQGLGAAAGAAIAG